MSVVYVCPCGTVFESVERCLVCAEMAVPRVLADEPPSPKFVAVPAEIVERIVEYLHGNVPADGWGILDRAADNERLELLSALEGRLL